MTIVEDELRTQPPRGTAARVMGRDNGAAHVASGGRGARLSPADDSAMRR